MLGLSLVVLGLAKVLTSPPHAHATDVVVAILRSPEIRTFAAALEIVVGSGLALSDRAVFRQTASAWVAALCGVFLGLVWSGSETEICGCLGSDRTSISAHIAVLCGLCALTVLASAPPNEAEITTDPRATR
jgi:hypothetical protein